MPDDTVHFVWEGDLSTENKKICCKSGPASLAKLSPETDIKVWVSETAIGQAKELFKEYKNITVRSTYRMLDSHYGQLKFIQDKTNAIKTLYYKLGKGKSFAAQKDLISFAIIAEFGGYFFDTTTQFKQKPFLPPVENFKVLLLEYQMPDGTVSSGYGSDVWAFAGKAGHKVFLRALERTLQDSGSPDASECKTFGLAIQFALEEVNVPKDLIKNSGSWVAKSEKNTDGQVLNISELFMDKIHVGSWRGYTPQQNAEHHPVAFQRLGLIIPPPETKLENKPETTFKEVDKSIREEIVNSPEVVLLQIKKYISDHVKELGAAKDFFGSLWRVNLKSICLDSSNKKKTVLVAAKIADIWKEIEKSESSDKLGKSVALFEIRSIAQDLIEKPDPSHDAGTKKFFKLLENDEEFYKAFVLPNETKPKIK